MILPTFYKKLKVHKGYLLGRFKKVFKAHKGISFSTKLEREYFFLQNIVKDYLE
jgi:hypothetical protein